MDANENSLLLPRPSINTRTRSKCSIPCRYSLALMGCFGFSVVYALRVNLSVALVAMVNSTDNSDRDGLHNAKCQKQGFCNSTLTGMSSKHKQFYWNEETQGMILGAFFYGYMVTQIPGGWIATKYGGKHTFGFAILFCSLLTLLTPVVVKYGVPALVVLRVLEGLAQGVTFPAMLEIISSWAPPLERSRLTTLSTVGCGLGNIITQPIAGLLCQSDFLGGWPSAFYVFGILGVVWYILWIFLVHEKPIKHPRITEEEKRYILLSIGNSQDRVLKNHSVPWLAIITSPAVYAVVIGYFCLNWGYYVFLTCLPTFFKEVLHLEILENGIISSIPYLTGVTFKLSAATLGDWLLSTGSRVLDVRRVFVTSAFLVPACLLISLSYIESDNKVFIIVMISLILGFASCTSAGISVNQLDIAPRYAGIITGFANCLGTIPGFLAPQVTGLLTNGEPTRRQWQKVFYIAAVIYVFGVVGFLILGKGEEQSWNTPKDDTMRVETEDKQLKSV